MISRRMARWAICAIAAATPLLAQQPPLQIVVTQAENSVRIQNGATINFAAPLGQAQTAQVRVTYSGIGQLLISSPPSIFGAPAFSTTFTQTLPLTLNPGEIAAFEIQYRPTSAAIANAFFEWGYRESVPNVGTGAPPTTALGSINFALQGTSPSLVLSYLLQSEQNVVPLQSGGAILYPATPINTTVQAALSVTNLGSAAGGIAGISLSGSNFRLAGIPLLPVNLVPGQTFQVQVFYTPTEVRADNGTVTIRFADSSSATINLQGSGTSARFIYQILRTDPPETISAGGTLSFEEVSVGQSSTVEVQVVNAGNSVGTISTATVSGQGFQLTGAPVLPQTLAPNAGVTFTITFTPTVPGASTGRFAINSEVLNLSGSALGTRLTFSYDSGGSTITLGTGNNSVIFSPVIISESGRITLRIRNSGTSVANIANIGVGQATGPFSVSGLPALPVSLNPGAELGLGIIFTPTVLGFSNGTLQVDSTSIALVGSGSQPPPLPAYTIVGPSATVAPASQPGIGLTLAAPYPVTISGALIVSVSGDLPADPAVQFATGGRVVPFLIPANSTEAIFGTQGTRIGLQTGTVASTFTLTPSFATQAGGIDLTPQTPATLRFAVAPAAPVLIASQISTTTANSFVIDITGFTTTRSLTSWRIDVTLAADVDAPTSQFTIDIQQLAAAWFRSANSQSFGGQFSMAIPVTIQGTVPTGETLLSKVASVTVSVSNSLGSSNALTSRIP